MLLDPVFLIGCTYPMKFVMSDKNDHHCPVNRKPCFNKGDEF